MSITKHPTTTPKCPQCGSTRLKIIQAEGTSKLFIFCESIGCWTFPIDTSQAPKFQGSIDDARITPLFYPRQFCLWRDKAVKTVSQGLFGSGRVYHPLSVAQVEGAMKQAINEYYEHREE